jgi:hypothetical protein
MGKQNPKHIKTGQDYLHKSFIAAQEVLKKQLELSRTSITHNGIMGEVNEKHFIATLRAYLPQRYQVSSAIVLDSDGKTSQQIDVVIYDEQYTPTLLDQQGHRFVPSEAVYAVFEVKPTINKEYLEAAAKKAASVRELKRTSIDIHHAGGVFPAIKLFNIVAGIISIDVSWKDGLGSKFQKIFSGFEGDKHLDCALAVSGSYYDIYKFDPSKVDETPCLFNGPSSLAYFLFRFLHKLQTLGTVPAVDWERYASVLTSMNAPK